MVARVREFKSVCAHLCACVSVCVPEVREVGLGKFEDGTQEAWERLLGGHEVPEIGVRR